MSAVKNRKRRFVKQGDVFNRLTVMEIDKERSTIGKRFIFCKCECGKIISVRPASLTSENTKSCGCYGHDKHVVMLKSRSTHGQSLGLKKTKLYDAWVNMTRRCYDSTCDMFHRYGGRGITVCSRWKTDRSSFFSDMGEAPSKQHSIDRIENDKGYWCGKSECSECGPSSRTPNVKWSTVEEQSVNRSNNRFITHDGMTRTVSEWVKITGIDRGVIEMRLYVLKWPAAKALTEPIRKPKTLTHNGETLTVKEWAERSGLTTTTIFLRINRLKWDIGRAVTTPSQKRR